MPWGELDSDETTRFFFDKDQVEYVDLRIASEDILQSFREELGIKPRTLYVPNEKKDNALEAVQAPMDQKLQDALIRRLNFYNIAGWKLLDKAGNEVPHSEEAVNLMITKSKRFAAFVLKHLRQLRDDQNAALEAEIKNS